LEGRTKGYKHHPQLDRFKKSKNPVDAINQYLTVIYLEAARRDYNFDRSKINWLFKESRLSVSEGQLKYESDHLLIKLQVRAREKFQEVRKIKSFDAHPLFRVINGEIENWEIVIDRSKTR
jgi:hypothetical protein